MPATSRVAAKICYVGDLGTYSPLNTGLMFGVEIMEKRYLGFGTIDGTYQGVRYFYCQDNCGLFVSLEKLSPDQEGSTLAKAPPGGQAYGKGINNPPNTEQGPNPGSSHEMITRSKMKTQDDSSVDPPPRQFEKGDRVKVHNKQGVPVHGTVHWVGRKTATQQFQFTVVGIKTDVPMRRENGIPGMTHLFAAKDKRCQLFVPEALVLDELEQAGDVKGGQHKPPPAANIPIGKSHPEDKAALAKEVGLSAEEMLAIGIDVNQQLEALQVYACEKEKNKRRREEMGGDSQRGERGDTPVNNYFSKLEGLVHPQGGGCEYNRQHSWQHPTLIVGQRHRQFDIGSVVQVSDRPIYGVIRWIGELPEVQGTIAGLKLEKNMDGCADGTWHGTRYFTCPYGRGFLCPFFVLKPDQRNPLIKFPMEEPVYQTIGYNQITKYLGEGQGIQGHQNSCYLDATAFGLFALSDVFDDMFLREAKDPGGQEIKKMLWKGIVNPLRKNGVVRHESVMRLRNKLEELGKMKGVNQDGKDPEEFLNMLFKHTLNVEPFISIKRPFGVEQEYFVQLFLEHDEQMKLPTVGDLLWKMFTEQDISFTRVPSKLLIQVPKGLFKTYKIIPGLKLDVRGLIASPCKCFICHKSAWKRCSDCVKNFIDEKSLPSQFVLFCNDCSKMVHTARSGHHVEECLDGGITELELLSVICIETSHYVCFSRSEDQWIFFDSMANRVYDSYNIPKGVECTRELNEWVYSGDHQRLMDTPPRKLPEYVRRFTQDLYMCVYIQPDVDMYGSDYHAPTLGIMDPPADVCPEIPRQLNDRQEFLEKENTTLKSQLVQLQESLSEQREETQKHKQELQGVQAKYLRLASEMEQVAQQNQKAQQHLQEECSQLQGQRDKARQSEQELRQQVERLQDRLQTTQAEMQQLRSAPQVTTQEVEFWKVPRKEVKIASHIGEGAWGYVAKGTFRGQDVAVKWPHERLLDPYTINRLRREVRIMAQVRHPHLLLFIAAVFDREADRLEAPPMIITELLAMNLREAYKTGKLQGASKLSIYRDIACALNYLHQHQEPIIHRDVSAPNVLLEALPDGMWRAKLSDFGSANLAKLAQTMGEGAIIYSAPETIPALVHDPDAPAPPQTVKLDVYSYGVLLCEVTTSHFPNPEQYRSMLQQVQRQWQFIYNLIVSCTKRAPEERPTMALVLDELNKLPRRKVGPHQI